MKNCRRKEAVGVSSSKPIEKECVSASNEKCRKQLDKSLAGEASKTFVKRESAHVEKVREKIGGVVRKGCECCKCEMDEKGIFFDQVR